MVPQESLRYNVFLYGLKGDSMEDLINRNSEIINNAENAYLYFHEKINFPGLTYFRRELNILESYTELYEKLELQLNELNIFINANYIGESKPITHALMTAKLTGEIKKFVLAKRLQSEIYILQNEVQSISFGSNLFNENPIFMKLPGLEVLPRGATIESPVFIIEYDN
jgi:hypothetical protein